MVVFCKIVISDRHQFNHDLPFGRHPETSGINLALDILHCLLCHGLLLRCMIVDSRSVLCSSIVALAIQHRWICPLKKSIQEISVSHRIRIIRHLKQNLELKALHARTSTDLDSFCMTSSTTADLLIGWIFRAASGVSHTCFDNTWDSLKRQFQTPEASTYKSNQQDRDSQENSTCKCGQLHAGRSIFGSQFSTH